MPNYELRKKKRKQMLVKCWMSIEIESAKKRNGQTNPLLRKLNAARENGLVLPQSRHGWSKRSKISGQPSAVSYQRSATGGSLVRLRRAAPGGAEDA